MASYTENITPEVDETVGSQTSYKNEILDPRLLTRPHYYAALLQSVIEVAQQRADPYCMVKDHTIEQEREAYAAMYGASGQTYWDR